MKAIISGAGCGELVVEGEHGVAGEAHASIDANEPEWLIYVTGRKLPKALRLRRESHVPLLEYSLNSPERNALAPENAKKPDRLAVS